MFHTCMENDMVLGMVRKPAVFATDISVTVHFTVFDQLPVPIFSCGEFSIVIAFNMSALYSYFCSLTRPG